MKKSLCILFVCAIGSGCTVVSHPSGWSYRSFGFQKTISELAVSTNGTMTMKGYASKDTQMIEAAAYGAAKGLAAGANPIP